MPDYERFKFALSTLDPAKWRLFERLATVFLAEEFPSLRPLASMSGDEGMDALLFKPEDDPSVVLQFSVRKDWREKVRETCGRLRQTAPSAQMLIYATNQDIGANASSLKRSVRDDYRLFLDVRDREWFLTHRNYSRAIETEAEEFCRVVGDPAVSERFDLGHQAQVLDDLEARAAFVYLGLQWEDDTREKGLTRLCYEAVIRAVLRETTSEERMTRAAIKRAVGALLPAQDTRTRDDRVDGALTRLTKIHIRHWQKSDEFCLTWDERVRLKTRLLEMESLDQTLRQYLKNEFTRLADQGGSTYEESQTESTVELARATIERVLLDRGEAFAEAVVRDSGTDLRFEDIEAVVYQELATSGSQSGVAPRVVISLVQSSLVDPPEELRQYLRSLSDTYTLFAFMRETPDVQSAVVKIFSDGDIWLDTSVVLPALAETLLADESHRNHTIMLQAAHQAGLRLFVTEGVIEELNTHIHRCSGYLRARGRGEATGPEPFLLTCYRLSGREMAHFDAWLEMFSGRMRPEDDLADYLTEYFDIELMSLHEFVDQAPDELRAQVGEIWHEARDGRDRKLMSWGGAPMDQGTRHRLVSHDVENYLGVQMRRKARSERRSAFGYRTWWLTLDGTAFRVARELQSRTGSKVDPSPAISPDFMLHYLAVGPVRARLSRKTEEVLPLMLNMSILDAVPPDLIDLSDALRAELVGRPAHVIRRKVRDTMDKARYLLGEAARAGENGLNEDIRARLIAEAKEER